MRKIVETKGCKKYYLNDLLHREDGPAIERSDGINDWYIYGKMKGMQLRDGNSNTFSYYMDGESYTEEKFKTKILYDLLQEDVPKINTDRKKNKL